MAQNVPNPGDTVVPSAGAERRRMFLGDARGTTIYALAVALIAVVVLAIVAFA